MPGPDAQRVLDALASEGASYLADLSTVTGLGAAKLRESLAELAAGGLVTNDSPDALRAIATLQPLPRPVRDRAASDPTRWLPANFERSMPVVQRRVNPRRLPKWTRPDRPDAARDAWTSGRWSLVRTNSVLGPDEPEEERAEAIARQWLARYGVVSRDWWRRERPPVPWRDIYYELRRLELRGEVRRGYFVTGLAGAQFALPEAVESLRAAARDTEAPLIVMTATDPANAFALPLPQEQRDPISRPRGGGATLVTRAGTIVLAVESRGRRVRVAPDADEAAVTAAARALGDHLLAQAGSSVRYRDVNVETIDGVSAASSRWSEAFRAAGFRMNGTALRLLAPVR
jgi:ATP-dependent Lhr-like helicase